MFRLGNPDHPVHVADIGCGNGRFACMLDSLGIPVSYTGVDAEVQLLELARANTAGLQHTQVRFVQADIVQPGWMHALADHLPAFDMVVCLATLQHIPSYELRQQVVCDLAAMAAPSAIIAVSAWQFLSSERFIARQIAWNSVGLDDGDVEAGRRPSAMETGSLRRALCSSD